MPTIGQYSTLFDFKKGIRFLYETNRLAYFDPIWVPNSKTNTEYFGIMFSNQTICPSLLTTHTAVVNVVLMCRNIETEVV